MSVQILIYGSTIEIANNKLDKIAKTIKDENIYKYFKSSILGNSIELTDGCLFKSIALNHNIRGYKWQYAYIDKNIDNKILEDVILASFIPKNKSGKITSIFNDIFKYAKEEDFYEFY